MDRELKSFFPLFFLLFRLFSEEVYPTVILGSGVGGLSAALYLARSGLSPLVIMGPSPGGETARTECIQNWPGELNISGSELVEKMVTQVEKNGGQLSCELALSVNFKKRPFEITLVEPNNSSVKRKIKAETVLIALGTKRKTLSVPGEKEYEGRGVFSCALCDGFAYKDRVVAVVGGGDSAFKEAQHLSRFAKKVYILVRGENLSCSKENSQDLASIPRVQLLYNSQIKEIKGNGNTVNSLVLDNGSDLPVDALFVAIGATPNTSLFKGQLEIDAKGYIVLKNGQQTSIPGIFAVGDVADPEYKQAITAAGDGAKAAIEIERSFKKSISYKIAAPAPTFAVQEVNSMQELTKFITAYKKPTVVFAFSPSCPPCRQFHPEFVNWARNHEKSILCLKCNVYNEKDICDTYQIAHVPSCLLFDVNGHLQEKESGSFQIKQMLMALDKKLKP